MNENYIAIGANSLYPDIRGRKTMPEATVPPPEEDNPRRRPVNGENSSEKRAEVNRQKEEAKEVLKEAKAAQKAKPQEIPAKSIDVVKEVAKNISSGTGVVLSQKEAKGIRELVVQHSGIDPRKLSELNDEQIFFVANKLFNSDTKVKFEDVATQLDVSIADDFGRVDTNSVGTLARDWTEALPDPTTAGPELGRFITRLGRLADTYTEDDQASDLRQELARIGDQIENAIANGRLNAADANVGAVDGILTAEIAYLRAREVAMRRAETEAAMRARERLHILPKTDEEIQTTASIDRLVELQTAGTVAGAEWEAAAATLGELEAMADAPDDAPLGDYKRVFYIYKAARDYLRQNEALKETGVGNLLNQATTTDAAGWMTRINRKFERAYNALSREERQSRFSDIDRQAEIYFRQTLSGWGETPAEAMQSLQTLIGEEADALRVWKGIRAINGLQLAIDVSQLTEPPINWEDTPEKIANIYRFVESTDFTVEDLQATINKAINMVAQVQPDSPDGRRMKERLSKELEAFRAFHSMRITMERNDMNPERMIEVYSNYFDDETWATFSDRFAKDERGLDYYDGENNKINPFDVAFKLYSDKLRKERIQMNIVEAMTKHSIGGHFNGATKKEIQIWAGLRNKDGSLNPFFMMTEGELDAEIESLRLHFVEKMQDYINDPVNRLEGKSVDDIWGIKANVLHTWRVVSNWHTQRTLQGASGFNETTGGLYLDERREEMRTALQESLTGLGIKVKLSGEGDTAQYKPIDIGRFKEAGELDSLDRSAHYLAWMFEWSNYDTIRIYSRDSKSYLDDDFTRIVAHKNTNLFYGRAVDHLWEYFHDDNENRGRAKENDVNRIWKQNLPGKHHYMLPQNTLMVRWAGRFMTREQFRWAQDQIDDLIRDYDFTTKDESYYIECRNWMMSVVVMDMIENGQLGFGQQKFSEVAHGYVPNQRSDYDMVKKFEMIDLFADRNKHVNYTSPKNFQAYLADPSTENFLRINDKTTEFYSTRNARLFPWMTLNMRAHWEVGSKHLRRLFNTPNMTAASGEGLVDSLVASSSMERKQGEREKNRLFGVREISGRIKIGEFVLRENAKPIYLPAIFGWTPFRRARQFSEGTRRAGWDAKWAPFIFFIMGFIAGLGEFIKQIPKQTTEGLGGGR